MKEAEKKNPVDGTAPKQGKKLKVNELSLLDVAKFQLYDRMKVKTHRLVVLHLLFWWSYVPGRAGLQVFFTLCYLGVLASPWVFVIGSFMDTSSSKLCYIMYFIAIVIWLGRFFIIQDLAEKYNRTLASSCGLSEEQIESVCPPINY